MTSVTFDPSVGGDGSTFHDGVGVGGMAEGGHALYFFPCLQQYLAVAGFTEGRASDAEDAAASALNAPGTSATTISSITVGTGSKTFTLVETGKLYVKGQRLTVASSANALNSIQGPITAVSGDPKTITINSDTTSGSGTFTDGVVSLSGAGGIPASRRVDTSGLIQGGGPLSSNLTLSVIAATAAEIRAALDATKVMTASEANAAGAEVTLTAGASLTTQGDAILDGKKFQSAVAFLTSDTVLPNITDPRFITYRFRFVQDSTGNRKVNSWGSMYVTEGGKPTFTLTTAPGWSDYLYVDVVSSSLAVCSFIKGPTN